MNSPGYRPCLERRFPQPLPHVERLPLSGAVRDEQTVAPLREMRGQGVLFVLWALAIGMCLAMAWEWLS